MGFMLYRSSAGSGKTYTLVKEYLKLVLKNPESFKHVLAITFTNKAAGEMKERILQSLKKLAKGEDPSLENLLSTELPGVRNIDRIASRILTNLLHNYSDFAIMTIDSFIHRVIKSFALEIGLPLNFGIDLSIDKIRTYITENLLAGVGRDEHITRVILEFVFDRVRKEKSWNIEGEVLRFENELFKEKNVDWIRTVREFDVSVFEHFKKQMEQLRNRYIQRLNELGGSGFKMITDANLSIDDFAYKKSGAAGFLQKCATLRSGDLRNAILSKRFEKEQWLTKSAPAGLQAAVETLLNNGLADIHHKIVSLFDTPRAEALTADFILENIYLSAIINQMTRLVDDYKKKNNVIPISEFNTRVYEIVKNSPVPFIYAILGEKYRHYLVDEFQDTSRLQWENLFPLIDNSMGTDSFSMAVGDGKQSIYRWRGGDMEIMESDIRRKINPELLNIQLLEKNYRSRRDIVEFNNRFFEAVSRYYGGDEDNKLLEQVYEDVRQETVSSDGGFVTLQFIETPEEIVDNASDALTNSLTDADEEVCRQVKLILEQSLRQGFTWGDIAILVRENKKGRMVAEYLLEQKIPVVSPDSLALARVPLVRFLIDVLTFLAVPTDNIARASIIFFLTVNRADNPLEPTDTAEKIAAVLDKKDIDQWELPENIKQFFTRSSHLIRMPVYEIIEEVIRVFNLAEGLDFETGGYLQAFLDVVSSYTEENSVDVSTFLDWWETGKNEFSVMVPETKPAVKIMTIHKAKGLEFPVVIIPYSVWQSKPDEQLWLRPEPLLPTEPPLDMPMPVKSVKALEETYFKTEYARELSKVKIDNINLLYVAFTRAVDRLHILARPRKNNENYILLNELAAPLMNEDTDSPARFTFGIPGTTVVKPSPEPAETEAPGNQLEINYHEAQQLISNTWYSRITIRRKSREFWRFNTGDRFDKRSRGILIHRLLSEIKQPRDLQKVLDNAFVTGEIEEDEKQELQQQLMEIFEIDAVKKWFSPRCRVFAESSIITGDGILRPDRVLIDNENVVIIDFKTGEAAPRHLEQINTYKKAIEAMGYTRVEAYLFYLETKTILDASGMHCFS
jgi:ATP-dependent helicase/nuclease subunit A